jgi:hypothetical protein
MPGGYRFRSQSIFHAATAVRHSHRQPIGPFRSRQSDEMRAMKPTDTSPWSLIAIALLAAAAAALLAALTGAVQAAPTSGHHAAPRR